MRNKTMQMGAVVVLFAACCAEAVLVKPLGLGVYKEWNFDGDGVVGGTVDSGASATDWINHSWVSVQDDGGFSSKNAAYKDPANLFVNTSGDGTLTYQAPIIGPSGTMVLDLGGDRSNGYFEMRALAEALPGGVEVFSAKYTFRDSEGNDLFILNLRKDNQFRWTTASGEQSTTATVHAYNSYQVAWDNGTVSLFFDDEAGGAGGAVSHLNQSYIGNSVADVAEIQFEITTSGTAGKATIDRMTIAVIPEPVSLGLISSVGSASSSFIADS